MFDLTSKQERAVMNMETFLNIRSHREKFESYEVFCNYFDLLSRKCNKKRKKLELLASGKLENSNNKRRKAVEKYYNDYDNLRQYAINYINRYVPSKGQLERQLFKKTNGNTDLIEKILKDFNDRLDDEKLARNIVRYCMDFGKNISYIKTKLIRKRIKKEDIEKVLDDFSGESILVEENVLKQVKRLKEKQKSKNEILYKLVERKEDKEIVMSCIEKVFCEDDEIKILKKQIEKLKIRGISKEKIFSRLIQKGFSYKDIKNIY